MLQVKTLDSVSCVVYMLQRWNNWASRPRVMHRVSDSALVGSSHDSVSDRVRFDRKEPRTRGRWGRGLGAYWKWNLEKEILLNFQIKNAWFCAFLLQKTILVAINRNQGASSTPWALKMQNGWGWGGWKFSNPQPRSTRTLVSDPEFDLQFLSFNIRVYRGVVSRVTVLASWQTNIRYFAFCHINLGFLALWLWRTVCQRAVYTQCWCIIDEAAYSGGDVSDRTQSRVVRELLHRRFIARLLAWKQRRRNSNFGS